MNAAGCNPAGRAGGGDACRAGSPACRAKGDRGSLQDSLRGGDNVLGSMNSKRPLNHPWALCSLFSAFLSLPPPAFCHFSGWLSHESPLLSPTPMETAPFGGLHGAPAKAGMWDGKAPGQDFPYQRRMRGFLPFGCLGATPWWQFCREMVLMLSIIREGGSVELEVRELPVVVGGWGRGDAGRMLRCSGCPPGSPRRPCSAVLGRGASLRFLSSSSCAA